MDVIPDSFLDLKKKKKKYKPCCIFLFKDFISIRKCTPQE